MLCVCFHCACLPDVPVVCTTAVFDCVFLSIRTLTVTISNTHRCNHVSQNLSSIDLFSKCWIFFTKLLFGRGCRKHCRHSRRRALPSWRSASRAGEREERQQMSDSDGRRRKRLNRGRVGMRVGQGHWGRLAWEGG